MRSSFFGTLHSKRRLTLCQQTNAGLCQSLRADVPDALRDLPGLDDFAFFAADGHYHAAAAKRKAARLAKSIEAAAKQERILPQGVMTIQRHTQRSLKLIRWVSIPCVFKHLLAARLCRPGAPLRGTLGA